MHPSIYSPFIRYGIILAVLFAVVGLGLTPESAAGQSDPSTKVQEFPLRLEPINARINSGKLILNLSTGRRLVPLAVDAQVGENPQLIASTYLGGSTWDSAYAVAVDSTGAVYVAGETPAADFPTSGGFGNSSAAQLDAFLVKIAPGGTAIEYAVLLGGGSLDSVFALKVENGIAYLAGETWSRTFPDGAAPAGENDVWAAAVTPDGSGLVYAVRFGGSDQDRASGLAVQNKRVILTGVTWSPDFPAAGFHGGADVFVVQLGPTGTLEESQLFGGSDIDAGFAIDQNVNQTLVCGQTWSRNFPLRGLRGEDDGFVMLLDENLAIVSGSLIGGSSEDSANACAFGSDGSILAAGRTASTDLAAEGESLQGEEDAFIARFKSDGTLDSLVLLGGAGMDGAQALVTTSNGLVWIAGMTTSDNFPVTSSAHQTTLGGSADAFLASFNMNDLTAGAQYASFVGGSSGDYAQALAVSPNGLLVLTGFTQSANFPMVGSPLFGQLNGSQDAFITWWGEPETLKTQPTATLQPIIPTGTPAPTLSEAELSAAETAGPPPAPTEAGGVVNISTVTSENRIANMTPSPDPQHLSLTLAVTKATAPEEKNTPTITESRKTNPNTGAKLPIGWGIGAIAVVAAGVGAYLFFNRKKIE